jgi:hypothetical protein
MQVIQLAAAGSFRNGTTLPKHDDSQLSVAFDVSTRGNVRRGMALVQIGNLQAGGRRGHHGGRKENRLAEDTWPALGAGRGRPAECLQVQSRDAGELSRHLTRG